MPGKQGTVRVEGGEGEESGVMSNVVLERWKDGVVE